ncbi:MAG: hypothetical protein GY757_29715 [bacterium]|nr:hypothetical protein [bacterium]
MKITGIVALINKIAHMKPEYRKGLGAVLLLLTIGLFLIAYSLINNPEKIISRAFQNKEINVPFEGERNAVYLIRDVKSACRPCSKYASLRKDPSVKILFYVEQDFTDNDIANFRTAFDIPGKYTVERRPDNWQYLYQKCNSGNDIPDNLLILIDENLIVKNVWRF